MRIRIIFSVITLIFIGSFVYFIDLKSETIGRFQSAALNLAYADLWNLYRSGPGSIDEGAMYDAVFCPPPVSRSTSSIFYPVSKEKSIPDSVNKSLDLRWISKTESNNLKIFYDKICLNRDAANALINMATAARADGVSIGVTSGYRPPILQQMVWDYWNKLQPDIVELEVAKPGYSEHQLGTAIDVTSEEIKWRGVDYKFKFTKTYSWLKKMPNNLVLFFPIPMA